KQSNKQAQQKSFSKTNFAIIRDMVLANLKYPNNAKRMGWQGVVEVQLVVSQSGKLLEYKIYKSSGKRQLDQAALNAVKSIANKNLPKPQTKTTLILPIGFKLN
ncbi:MAG TPA: energy transducer TonB, partial [Epsilonproteobacteria bacterium]|nr:energy transducer TonB [Campylobacterota bacterium]